MPASFWLVLEAGIEDNKAMAGAVVGDEDADPAVEWDLAPVFRFSGGGFRLSTEVSDANRLPFKLFLEEGGKASEVLELVNIPPVFLLILMYPGDRED